MRFAPGRSPGEAARCDQATTPSGSTTTRARFVMPAGSKYAPKARAVAPLGSKSESCSIDTPSFSRNAAWAGVASVDTAYITAPRARSSSSDLLVDLQLVGADRAEREGVEDEDRRAAEEVGPREVAAVLALERELRRRRAGGDDAQRYLRSPSSRTRAR